MDMTFYDFYNTACAKFGEDKFTIKPIDVSDEYLEHFNSAFASTVTMDDVISYKAVWLLKPICPKCESELDGIFGTFEWGLAHGFGKCSECGTSFQLYHYFGNCKKPIEAFSLIGF